MWEYNMIIFTFKTKEELKTELNKHGKDNWEVIFYSDDENKSDKFSRTTNARVLFKRKINV